jgi:hypothetical protein
MDYAALVTTIGNALTQLDTVLTSSALNNQPAQWQQLYALRKHLDDQQRTLVQQSIASDNVAFQALANSIQAATNTLNQEIKAMNRIDSIITVVSQISANLDQVLKLV